MADDPRDQIDGVRAGYNVLSRAYRADTADEATQRQYAGWLGLVRDRAQPVVTCSTWVRQRHTRCEVVV